MGRTVELPWGLQRLNCMWRSAATVTALAGLLAGCSLGGSADTVTPTSLVVRVSKVTTSGKSTVVRAWRLGCSPPGEQSRTKVVIPPPAVACRALRDYVTLRSPSRGCSCVSPRPGEQEATVTGMLDGKRVDATLPSSACPCSLSSRQVRDLQAVTGLRLIEK
jgi:hypothetical protein